VTRTKRHRCPVCKKPLTQKEYEKALGILGERERHLHERLRDAKQKEKTARERGVKAERARTQRLLAGKDKQIQILKERMQQLKRGSTPQTEGLEFEEKLATRLRREFPADEIQHKGKGGDVLHLVLFEGKVAGAVIYECKRTPRIEMKHVDQARRAKKSRDAHFAVLVTTGARRGFSGLAQMGGVLVVSPLGVVALAGLLRAHIIEMMRAGIAKEQRARIADELVQYVSSPQFQNPIADVVQRAVELQGMVQEEAKQHVKMWARRWEHYQTIQWDVSQVRSNVQLVLHGERPQVIASAKIGPLLLPQAPQ